MLLKARSAAKSALGKSGLMELTTQYVTGDTVLQKLVNGSSTLREDYDFEWLEPDMSLMLRWKGADAGVEASHYHGCVICCCSFGGKPLPKKYEWEVTFGHDAWLVEDKVVRENVWAEGGDGAPVGWRVGEVREAVNRGGDAIQEAHKEHTRVQAVLTQLFAEYRKQAPNEAQQIVKNAKSKVKNDKLEAMMSQLDAAELAGLASDLAPTSNVAERV